MFGMGKKIYLSGATTDFDNPIGWHENLQEEYEDLEFINPYSINDVDVGTGEAYNHPERICEPARKEILDSDGMIVKWDSNTFLPGTVWEMTIASEIADIPIIMEDNSRDWIHIKYMCKGIYKDMDKCVKIMQMLLN